MRLRAGLALGLIAMPAWGQRQYEGLKFPPYEVFDALEGFAAAGDFPALEKTAQWILPLFQALDQDGSRGLEREFRQAAAARDAPRTRRAIRSLLLADLRFNLDAARGGPERRGELLQMAYSDYHFLSPAVRSADKQRDADIRLAFKRAYRAGDLSGLERRLDGLERLWAR